MTEAENVSVQEEQSPEAVAQATEAESVQQERQDSTQAASRKGSAEYNWAEARRAMDQRDRQIKELEQKVSQLQVPKTPDPSEDLDRLSETDLAEVGTVKKLIRREAEKVAQELFKQKEAATVDERLGLKFSDYRDIVSTENIEYLKQNEPELALSLIAMKDEPYSQGVAAYKMIKKLGITPNAAPSREREKASQNSQKPLSVNAVGKSSAIGNAHMFENGLTPELKAQLLKEMKEATKFA